MDAESGKTIPYEGAGFQIYAPDNTLITMSVPYPSNLTIDTFYTNSEGYLITPEMLVYDKGYKLVEVQAPHGYVLDSTPITFDITEENSTEEGSIVLTKVNKANYAQKGKITASIFIEKELQRVKRDVFEKLNQRDVLFVFPRCLSGGNTVLVLKEPKTETSKRRVYLPKTVAKMVLQRIKDIQEIKELLGDEYHDYNLLFSSSTGRPMEGQIITRALKKLIRDHNLPDVCFHSLRHSSITYKLKWSGGDIKAVQGDSGHARADMVTEQYSHILDEDRVANARRVDEQVYNQQPQQTQSDSNNGMNPTELLGQIFANPEMGKAFQAFLQQYHNNA